MNFLFSRFLKLLLIISEYSPLALLWMMKAFIIDFPMQKISFMKLPSVGEKIGLYHVESDYIKEFGMLKGTIKGYKVTVSPDCHTESLITVALPSGHRGLEISLSRPVLKAKKGISEFITDSWKFNIIFRTKRADAETAAVLAANKALINSLNEFYLRWIFNLDSLIINEREIFCRLKFGFYFFPHIPYYRLEELANGLIDIARNLEEA